MMTMHCSGHFDWIGILVGVRAVRIRPSLLWSRGRDCFPPPLLVAVLVMMPAVVSPSSASPWMDEAAVVPLAAVALQEVLAGARLVLGVVVLGDSSFPEINMRMPVKVAVKKCYVFQSSANMLGQF